MNKNEFISKVEDIIDEYCEGWESYNKLLEFMSKNNKMTDLDLIRVKERLLKYIDSNKKLRCNNLYEEVVNEEDCIIVND